MKRSVAFALLALLSTTSSILAMKEEEGSSLCRPVPTTSASEERVRATLAAKIKDLKVTSDNPFGINETLGTIIGFLGEDDCKNLKMVNLRIYKFFEEHPIVYRQVSNSRSRS